MAKTYHKDPRRAASLRRGEFLGIMGQACWYEEKWKHIYRTVIPSKTLDSEVAEIAVMMARGGAAICRQIMMAAYAGREAICHGDTGKADHAMSTCKRLIGAEVAASRTVEKLIGKWEVAHG